MTDKQLEEYTKLVIEAVRPLQDELNRANQQSRMNADSLLELEKSKGCLFATVYYVEKDSPYPDPIIDIKHVEVDTIQYKYLKHNEDCGKDNVILTKKIYDFEKDTLFNRLKKAMRGKL